MAGRVIVFGDLQKRYETEWNITQIHPDIHLETVARPWELVERATEGEFDCAVLLKGSIVEHERRMEAIASLRRNGFAGRIVVAGAFLSERQDAIAAGADYVFDSEQQKAESVIAAALYRPAVVADHRYLRYLFAREWARVSDLGDELPDEAPELVLVALSSHGDAAFFERLVAYRAANPGTRCILVDDVDDEDVRAEALASGIDPVVDPAEAGLPAVLELGRRLLRESWLERVSKA